MRTMLILFEQARCYLYGLIFVCRSRECSSHTSPRKAKALGVKRVVGPPVERFLLHTVAAPAGDVTDIEFKVDARIPPQGRSRTRRNCRMIDPRHRSPNSQSVRQEPGSLSSGSGDFREENFASY